MKELLDLSLDDRIVRPKLEMLLQFLNLQRLMIRKYKEASPSFLTVRRGIVTLILSFYQDGRGTRETESVMYAGISTCPAVSGEQSKTDRKRSLVGSGACTEYNREDGSGIRPMVQHTSVSCMGGQSRAADGVSALLGSRNTAVSSAGCHSALGGQISRRYQEETGGV